MIDVLHKLLKLLNQQERRRFYLLLPFMVVSAVIDVMGIAFVVPFMAVVVSANSIQDHPKLMWLYQHLHFTSINRMLVFLGIAALLALVIGNTFSAFMNWLTGHYVNNCRSSLANKLLAQYFHRPYVYFLNQHSSDLSKKLLNDVMLVADCVLTPLLQMITKSIGVVFILALLLVANPIMAFSITLVLGLAFVIVYSVFRKQLIRVDSERSIDINKMYRIANEGFGGIKEIKLLGKESNYLAKFSAAVNRFAKNNTFLFAVAQLPRYVLEIIAFGSVLVIVICLLLQKQNPVQIIPMLGLFAFACYRLMPSAQLIFASLSTVRSYKNSLDVLYEDFYSSVCQVQVVSAGAAKTNDRIVLKQELQLSGVTFCYPEAKKTTLDLLDLSIKANTTVGFVGNTGAGKTTLIDIILGLLDPQSGTMKVDGVIVTQENKAQWQKSLGYVPQHIFLADDTIAHNIAFGVPEDEVDYAAVEAAARIANIHDFIMQELPKKYHTFVGERGVRLSGGQRQRLGIARALYRNPDVLVMDEATSALDNVTENAVMEAIRKLSHKKTILLIAHRLTTVENSDVIYFMKDGKIDQSGSYASLLATHPDFQQMVYAVKV